MQPTYEELKTENESLKARVDELEGKKAPPDDWHSMMYLVLSIALHGLPVDLRRELTIGSMPPRADFLIKIHDPGVDLRLKIFSHFLKMNVVEYKGPGDDLGEEELWQAGIYLCAQARESLSKKEATSEDFTVTLFRKAKPEKLLKMLGDRVKGEKGIYSVEGWKLNVPTTIVVTGELEGDEYAGFRAISEHPALEDVRLLMDEGGKETDPALKNNYRDLLRLLSKVDRKTMEEAKRRYPEMAEAWMEIFAPEIREREIRAAVSAIICYSHCTEEEAVRSVAAQYNMSIDEVKVILEKNELVAV